MLDMGAVPPSPPIKSEIHFEIIRAQFLTIYCQFSIASEDGIREN